MGFDLAPTILRFYGARSRLGSFRIPGRECVSDSTLLSTELIAGVRYYIFDQTNIIVSYAL